MSAAVNYSRLYESGVSGPAGNAFAITPNDDNEITAVTRAIYIGVEGDLRVTMLGGQTVTFVGLGAGILHAIRVIKVHATGTTATDIVGVY
jgi:hypothetical protein